jgi:hypothetical protein
MRSWEKWEQFDLEKGVWTKPSHTTKQKKTEHLPLSTQVVSLLKSIKEEATGPYLFPGKIDGKPLQDIKKAWKTISTQSGLTNVRLHDLAIPSFSPGLKRTKLKHCWQTFRSHSSLHDSKVCHLADAPTSSCGIVWNKLKIDLKRGLGFLIMSLKIKFFCIKYAKYDIS